MHKMYTIKLQLLLWVLLFALTCGDPREPRRRFQQDVYAVVWTLIQTGFAANPRASPHPTSFNVFFARSEFNSTVMPAVHRPSPSWWTSMTPNFESSVAGAPSLRISSATVRPLGNNLGSKAGNDVGTSNFICASQMIWTTV